MCVRTVHVHVSRERERSSAPKGAEDKVSAEKSRLSVEGGKRITVVACTKTDDCGRGLLCPRHYFC